VTQINAEHDILPAPPFLSARFHLRYFPALIWSRLRPRAEEPRSSFANHGSVEYFLTLTGAAIAVALGLPAALQGSAIGVIAAGLGFLAIATLLIFSVGAARGTYAGFAGFRTWVFLFFPMSAMTVGALFGSLAHSHFRSLLYAAIGLAAGYPLGIGTGLSAQRLGWIAGMLDYLAMLGLFGVLVVDIVLVFL
jgi:hypothetical protein